MDNSPLGPWSEQFALRSMANNYRCGGGGRGGSGNRQGWAEAGAVAANPLPCSFSTCSMSFVSPSITGSSALPCPLPPPMQPPRHRLPRGPGAHWAARGAGLLPAALRPAQPDDRGGGRRQARADPPAGRALLWGLAERGRRRRAQLLRRQRRNGGASGCAAAAGAAHRWRWYRLCLGVPREITGRPCADARLLPALHQQPRLCAARHGQVRRTARSRLP